VRHSERKRRRFLARLVLITGGIVVAVSVGRAQTPVATPAANQALAAPGERITAYSPVQDLGSADSSRQLQPVGGVPAETQQREHPLMPTLRWAKQGLSAIENLKDYSAVLAKRERVRGKLANYEYLFVKIRHSPFSVYAYFQAPASVEGQEVIYIAGQNQGNMLAHKPHMAVTFSIPPDGMVAMAGRRYPLTEIGLVNLVRRLVEVGEQDVRYGECEVQYFTQAKVNKRPCTVIQVTHPMPRDVFRYYLARIFVDDELKLPVRYESYDWPSEPGGQPRLLEEYTYLDLKVNNGFTDEDFNPRNPDYHFQPLARGD
jgi:hypothetical protein